MWKDRIRYYFEQFLLTLKNHREAVDFTYKYRVWEGFWEYGWVVRFLIIIAIFVGFKFLSMVYDFFSQADASNPLAMINSMGNAMSNFAHEGYEFLFDGSMKYIMLVLLEIIIFHVCRRTIAILTNKDSETDLQAFIHAQTRMIKVVIRSWVMEMIATVLIKIFFGIFGFIDFLEPAAIFAIQCYYLGFAVLDNYHEQFGLTIKESAAYARNFIGVSLGVGLVMQLAFLVPVAGAIAGPFFGTIAVTLTMFEISDLHVLGRQVVEVKDEVT